MRRHPTPAQRRPRRPGRRRTLGREHELPHRADAAQHGPVAPGDARHRAHRARPSRARRSSSADVQIGYLHRCFEKEVGARDLHAGLPVHRPAQLRLADAQQRRLRDGGREAARHRPSKIPERAQYIRVIVGEMSRITDHLTCLGAGAMELGAFTVFLYVLKAREWLCELLEERLGRAPDPQLRAHRRRRRRTCPPDFADKLRDVPRQDRRRSSSTSTSCSTSNRSSATAWTASAIITQERRARLRLHRPDRALDAASPTTSARTTRTWSTTASTSTCRSARRATTSTATSCASRRCSQSMRILEQALEQIPDGPGHASTIRASSLPPKTDDVQHDRGDDRATSSIIMDGIQRARRRGLLVHRGRQRRARLLHRLRRHRPPVQVPRAPALLRGTGRR